MHRRLFRELCTEVQPYDAVVQDIEGPVVFCAVLDAQLSKVAVKVKRAQTRFAKMFSGLKGPSPGMRARCLIHEVQEVDGQSY